MAAVQRGLSRLNACRTRGTATGVVEHVLNWYVQGRFIERPEQPSDIIGPRNGGPFRGVTTHAGGGVLSAGNAVVGGRWSGGLGCSDVRHGRGLSPNRDIGHLTVFRRDHLSVRRRLPRGRRTKERVDRDLVAPVLYRLARLDLKPPPLRAVLGVDCVVKTQHAFDHGRGGIHVHADGSGDPKVTPELQAVDFPAIAAFLHDLDRFAGIGNNVPYGHHFRGRPRKAVGLDHGGRGNWIVRRHVDADGDDSD